MFAAGLVQYQRARRINASMTLGNCTTKTEIRFGNVLMAVGRVRALWCKKHKPEYKVLTFYRPTWAKCFCISIVFSRLLGILL